MRRCNGRRAVRRVCSFVMLKGTCANGYILDVSFLLEDAWMSLYHPVMRISVRDGCWSMYMCVVRI